MYNSPAMDVLLGEAHRGKVCQSSLGLPQPSPQPQADSSWMALCVSDGLWVSDGSMCVWWPMGVWWLYGCVMALWVSDGSVCLMALWVSDGSMCVWWPMGVWWLYGCVMALWVSDGSMCVWWLYGCLMALRGMFSAVAISPLQAAPVFGQHQELMLPWIIPLTPTAAIMVLCSSTPDWFSPQWRQHL